MYIGLYVEYVTVFCPECN